MTAGMYTYFLVMNDYGFKPLTLLGLAPAYGVIPGKDDTYNLLAGPCAGNTECEKGGDRVLLEYNSRKDNWVDARLFYYELAPTKWTECRFANSSKFFRISSVKSKAGNEVNICYSTEALRCAQCAYLVSIVVVQWAGLLVCKTRTLSISQ